ncbi:uncharacterized protein KY384_003380 [Bacidia gigantensis]|uniref:uncharacterized protein n=1 Tax=Bacidia gigantensis TaxID=2732470 RepID=UPI001D04CFF7|nr:uncharacterized protein KY384_003380 [Bacidia gigantensis]KAG8531748.1 hypothetical protein KY384_003380 [Bacidia gigantensis]
MTDPLSITFGVIGTTAVALQTGRKLKTFIENIDRAPKAIVDLSDEVSALNDILAALQSVISQATGTKKAATELVFFFLNQSLHNCVKDLDALSDKLKPFVKATSKPNRSKWRGFLWAYREKEFTDTKASFTNNVAVSSELSEVHTRIRKMQHKIDIDRASIADSSIYGSESGLSDHHYALRTFLMEAETTLTEIPDNASKHRFMGSTLNEVPLQSHTIISSSSEAFTTANTTLAVVPDDALDQIPIQSSVNDVPLQSLTIAPGLSGLRERLFEFIHQEYPCIKDGCVIPYVVAAAEAHDPQFSLERRDSHSLFLVKGNLISEVHLYGFKAKYLVVPYTREERTHFEALHDYVPSNAGTLQFSQGDILSITEQIESGWITGSLCKNAGKYPREYVRPCKFGHSKSLHIYDALRGKFVLGSRISLRFHSALREYDLGFKRSLIDYLDVKLKHSLVSSTELDACIQGLGDETRLFLRFLYTSDEERPRLFSVEDNNLRFLQLSDIYQCDDTEIPQLVTHAIGKIESNLNRGRLYCSIEESRNELSSLRDIEFEDVYPTLRRLAEDVSWPPFVLMYFFSLLEPPILNLHIPDRDLYQMNSTDKTGVWIIRRALRTHLAEMETKAYQTLKVLIQHLRHVYALDHTANLAVLWAAVLLRQPWTCGWHSEVSCDRVVEVLLQYEDLIPRRQW